MLDIIKDLQKPVLYEPGNAVMWTDPHISKQALDIHLNEHIDLGNRKPGTIQRTIDWMLSQTNKKAMKIIPNWIYRKTPLIWSC